MDSRLVVPLPRRPGSLPDWEDLLVRFEIMPRALRVTLEEAGRNPVVAARILRRIVEDEAVFSRWIDRAMGLESGGTAEEDEEEGPAGVFRAGSGGPADLAARFTSLRARNFSMLQRRGIDVWEWAAPLDGVEVSAFQMVTALVRKDAAALRELREGVGLGTAAC